MPKPWKIAIIVIALLAITVGIPVLAKSNITKFFQQLYFHIIDKPQKLETQAIGSFPSKYQIKDVPWISCEKSYSETTTLQMIAYKHLLKPSVGYLNFLMGFTYGAFYPGDQIRFVPYTDPIPGSRLAASYLGLEMKYLTTNDSESFFNALKFYLSREYPVGIQLNAAVLWDEKGLMAHTQLLVGYDESGFYYFDTAREDRFIEKAEGIKITTQVLAQAISELHEEFGRPSKFSLTIFEESEKKEGLSKIWQRNGESLVGSKWGPVSWGALAIKEFAFKIRKEKEIKNLWALEAMSYTRLDNAKFLEQHFAADREIKEAAQLLRDANEYYEKALEIAKGNIENEEKANEVADLLIKGASLEQEVGKIFISKGKIRH